MNGLEQIILNRVQCKQCGEILTSYHRHDYVKCSCPNETMTDGGQDYQRYGGQDLTKVDRSLTVYATDDHDVMRKAVYWGTYGKKGDEPRRWVNVAEMSNEHLDACILNLGSRMHPTIKKTMANELEYRINNNIIVTDNESSN